MINIKKENCEGLNFEGLCVSLSLSLSVRNNRSFEMFRVYLKCGHSEGKKKKKKKKEFSKKLNIEVLRPRF